MLLLPCSSGRGRPWPCVLVQTDRTNEVSHERPTDAAMSVAVAEPPGGALVRVSDLDAGGEETVAELVGELEVTGCPRRAPGVERRLDERAHDLGRVAEAA